MKKILVLLMAAVTMIMALSLPVTAEARAKKFQPAPARQDWGYWRHQPRHNSWGRWPRQIQPGYGHHAPRHTWNPQPRWNYASSRRHPSGATIIINGGGYGVSYSTGSSYVSYSASDRGNAGMASINLAVTPDGRIVIR
jgi:hypothetical protein